MTILLACSLPIDVTSVKHKKKQVSLGGSRNDSPLIYYLHSSSPLYVSQRKRTTVSKGTLSFSVNKINSSNVKHTRWKSMETTWCANPDFKRISIISKTFFQSVATYQFMTALMLQLLESIFGYVTSTFSDSFVTRFYNQYCRWKSRKGLTHT